jgi:hypothetical protein
MTAPPAAIDLDRLLKLRLVVARHGEMDGARWWNTQGMLGPRGAVVLGRGFPSTHYFAQARVVFAVARSRCQELFNPPRCMTLWNLPAEVEDQFEEHWQSWLDDAERWAPLFEALAAHSGTDLPTTLGEFDLVSASQLEVISTLRRSAENRAVLVPGALYPNDQSITLLAAAFSLGAPGSLTIPYATLES